MRPRGRLGIDGTDGRREPQRQHAVERLRDRNDRGHDGGRGVDGGGLDVDRFGRREQLLGRDWLFELDRHRDSPGELYQPCTNATQAVDCPNSLCGELYGDISGGFCTTPCRDASECEDPGTGASVGCRVTAVEGTPGSSCFLECSESGVAGCLDGMSCSPLAQLPDGSQVRLCYHPT